MTSGVSGYGTKLNWDEADIAELASISGPSQSMDTIELTSHGSADTFREFVAGLRSGGEISFEGNFIKGNALGQIAMHTDFQAGEKKAWIIKMPGWSAGVPQISGYGYVTAFELSFPSDGKISISGTIRVTGMPVLAPA
jgi:predicted secreted protein